MVDQTSEPEFFPARFFAKLETIFRRRHRCERVFLLIDGYVHELHPHQRTHIMTSVTAGHKVTYALVYLDTNGNPMLTAPTPDGTPIWSLAAVGTTGDTLVAAGDGNSAVLQTAAGDAAGTDTVNLTVTVGGKAFTATDSVSVKPPDADKARETVTAALKSANISHEMR